jgi:hypothetical protein
VLFGHIFQALVTYSRVSATYPVLFGHIFCAFWTHILWFLAT